MSEETNNATNEQIVMVREWLEEIHPLTYRLTQDELDELAHELAHRFFGYLKTKQP